jgi:hypothetical protein
MTDDVAALDRALERTEGPLVLVAHAYAGAVIAGSANERTRSLVFITALTPYEGETVVCCDKFHPEAPQLAPDRHGFLWIPEERIGTAFCQNASQEQTALLAATQRPIAIERIQQKQIAPAWKKILAWYLVAQEDRMINPATQPFLAQRMSAKIRAERIDHMPVG